MGNIKLRVAGYVTVLNERLERSAGKLASCVLRRVAASNGCCLSGGNGDKDVFVHARELVKAGIEISGGARLTGLILDYEVGLGKNNKKQAINIRLQNC